MNLNLQKIKFKPSTGLTAREFMLVIILIIAVEGYLLYTYLIQPAVKEFTMLAVELADKIVTLNVLKEEYSRKGEMESEIDNLEQQLKEVQKQVPPYLSQEEVILFIEDLSAKSYLTVQSIGFQNSTDIPLLALKSDKATTESSSVENTSSGNTSGTVPVVIEQNIGINYVGDYQQLYDFIKLAENSLRKVIVNGVTMQLNESKQLNGVINLSFISYWDESDGQSPFEMTTAPVEGKFDPFTEYEGYSAGAQNSNVTGRSIRPDFYLMINSYLNNSSKVFLMNYFDSGSEVIDDDNAVVNAKLILSGSNGSYNYRYVLGSYDKSGSEPIEVKGGRIRMEVVVQPRKSDQDLVGVIMDITNNTDVPFEITVKGDDNINPRFITGNTTGSVVVK